MGVHEAYHLDGRNRLVHWLAILVELVMVVKLLSLARVEGVGLGPLGTLDLSLVVLAAVGLVYVAADVVAGLLMVALLLGLRGVALRFTTGSGVADAAIAVVVFVVAFTIQTRVGHGVFEKGVDDTEKNIAELRRTKNPIPILLVFYYHLVELLFAAGYRPKLRAAMERHRDEELARIENDPRHA